MALPIYALASGGGIISSVTESEDKGVDFAPAERVRIRQSSRGPSPFLRTQDGIRGNRSSEQILIRAKDSRIDRFSPRFPQAANFSIAALKSHVQSNAPKIILLQDNHRACRLRLCNR